MSIVIENERPCFSQHLPLQNVNLAILFCFSDTTETEIDAKAEQTNKQAQTFGTQ